MEVPDGVSPQAGNEQALSVDAAFRLGLDQQKQGHLDDAARIYRSIVRQVPDHAHSLHYLGIIEHLHGNQEESLRLLRRALELRPDEAGFYQNLGGVYRACGRLPEALEVLQQAAQRDPHDYTALDNLCAACHELGRDEEACRYGQRALEEKDRQACQGQTATLDPRLLAQLPRPFTAGDRRKNLIAFSLWGDNPRYLEGAVTNAFLARHIYPEWMCRFYCDRSVSQALIGRLLAQGAQVIQDPEPHRGYFGLFWRFFAANDLQAERFLCRDCDSRLNVKERVAVEEWLASGQCFHVMRDNPLHTELILAGMWGGVTGLLPPLEPRVRAYLQQYGQRWADQHFLRDEIWPLIKPHALTHDSCYRLGRSQPFPRFGTLPPPWHVGGSAPWSPGSPDVLTC